MKAGVSTLERAFELARSGTVLNVNDIKRALDHEGYSSKSVLGSALVKQLLATIRAERERKNKPAGVTEFALTPQQLRLARLRLHWSRDRLAAQLDISRPTIVNFENEGIYSKSFDPQKARKSSRPRASSSLKAGRG
jgi:DNA-binding XRE family transcriptional regulator